MTRADRGTLAELSAQAKEPAVAFMEINDRRATSAGVSFAGPRHALRLAGWGQLQTGERTA
jgi:hypothetical protein